MSKNQKNQKQGYCSTQIGLVCGTEIFKTQIAQCCAKVKWALRRELGGADRWSARCALCLFD